MTKPAKIWIFVLFLLMMGAISSVLTGHTRFTTDIADLFPKQTNGSLSAAAIERTSQQISQKISFLLRHESAQIVAASSAVLKKNLQQIKGLSIQGTTDAEITHLNKLQGPAIGALASITDFETLENGDGEILVQRALSALFMPGSSVNSTLLKRDPLGLYQGFLSNLSMSAAPSAMRGPDGRYDTFFTLSLEKGLSSSPEKRGTLVDIEMQVTALVDKTAGLEIHFVGAPFYSQKIAEISKFEASRITAIAVVGIIVLLFFIFRSVQPILGALLIISIGVASGAAATMIFFGNVHLIAVAFGSSLIGVVVDYAIHYYSARRENESAFQTASRIRSGLVLGAGTSVMGFLALSFADVDVLRQIAVYSAFGVVGAGASVLYLLPLPKLRLWGSGINPPADKWQKFHDRFINTRWITVIYSLPVILAIALVMELPRPVDAVQTLRVSTPELSQAEAFIAKHSGSGGTKLLLVEGTTSEEILQREEILRKHFSGLITSSDLRGVFGISNLMSSLKRQAQVITLSQDLLASDAAKPLTDLIGHTSANPSIVPLTDENISLLPADVRSLQIFSSDENSRGHILILNGLDPKIDLEERVSQFSWVSIIDVTKGYSQGLEEMRRKATYALLGAIAVTGVFFGWWFGFIKGAKVMIAPACAALCAPVIAALFGIEISFFSIMACFLVFALSADYSLFQMAAHSDDRVRAHAAVSFSALSTLFVFGLLAFSKIPVLQTMGSIVVIGVVIGWVLAPLAGRNSKGDTK